MKRKQSEAQLANLELGKCYFNKETAKKANELSQEAKKLYKPFKEMAREVVTPEDFAAMAAAMRDKAIDGDPRAMELLLQFMGEKPAEELKVESNDLKVTLTVVE